MIYKKLNIGLILILLLVLSACDNKVAYDEYDVGILKNYNGFDGCSWIIQLTDSAQTMLEPVNLDDFNIDLIEEKKIYIKYQERIDLASICMVGKIIEINEIKEF